MDGATRSAARRLSRARRPGPLTVAVPGSKSISIRALWWAAATGADLRLHGLGRGEDVQVALDGLGRLGHGLEVAGNSVHLGRVAAGRHEEEVALEVGESGTCARFATAFAAACRPRGTRTRILGRGTLQRRRSEALFTALRASGAELATPDARDDGWPVDVVAGPRVDGWTLDAPASSQELSALLLACSGGNGGRVDVRGTVPSEPFVSLTIDTAARFGVVIEEVPPGRADARRWVVLRSEPRPERLELHVEPDASLAAVAWAAGVLGDGPVRVRGLGRESVQGDARALDHFESLGCAVESTRDGTLVRAGTWRAWDLDLRGEPDLAPVLVPLCARAVQATGRSCEVSGLETLPGKESDRLRGLEVALRAAGFGAGVEGGTLVVLPAGTSAAPVREGEWLDPRGDHRMAYAHVLFGLLGTGVLGTRDPHVVRKTWPGFWEDLAAAGFGVEGSGT